MNGFPLEPIEKASTDELRALQLKRLKATLHHAYANCAPVAAIERSLGKAKRVVDLRSSRG